MKSKQVRDIQRWFHLLFAAALGVYIYSPWSENQFFALALKAGVFPGLSFTGILLWKWIQIKKSVSSDSKEGK